MENHATLVIRNEYMFNVGVPIIVSKQMEISSKSSFPFESSQILIINWEYDMSQGVGCDH